MNRRSDGLSEWPCTGLVLKNGIATVGVRRSGGAGNGSGGSISMDGFIVLRLRELLERLCLRGVFLCV